MKHINDWNTYLNEGVQVIDGKYHLDFSGDKDGDIMSLSFSDKRTSIRKMEGVPYSYYYAYEFDSQKDKDLLKAVKTLDDRIDPEKAKMMVNKAVIGLSSKHPLNQFDTIVYPKSSSVVLKEMASQADKKSGNATMIPDVFVKAGRSDIKFDMEKIQKLPESTRKQVMKVIDSIKTGDGEFKLKEIYSRYRKFVKDFIIFNSEEDRRTHNAIVGKKVLLIDDYRTTGTTLKEMMSQLAKLQPSEIVVFLMIKVV
jgi:hypothetical protein